MGDIDRTSSAFEPAVKDLMNEGNDAKFLDTFHALVSQNATSEWQDRQQA